MPQNFNVIILIIRVYGSTACGSNQVITEIKEQPAVVELLLNLLCACMTSPFQKGWNRNGHVLSTKMDGSDGSGKKTNHPYAMPMYANQGKAPQSFEPFPYNLGFEFDDGTQVFHCLSSMHCIVSRSHYFIEYRFVEEDCG